MELNTAEKFLILVMHPKKARYVIPETAVNPGLFGSILVDLYLEEKIEFKDKRIISKSSYTKISKAHNMFLSKIAATKKKKRIKTWIANLAWNSRKYRHLILHDLALKGKIRLEDRRFLFIPYKSAFLIDINTRNSYLEDLKEILLNKQKIDSEKASLIGIIDACKIHRIITRDKESLKKIKENIKELVVQDSVSVEVRQVIREMQAAAIASTYVATSS